MALMPRGQPRSVPDPAGEAYDAMVAREKSRRGERSSPPPQIDPSTTEVFRPGPDGKLHPVDGWRTTGPFDFGAWSHNVNWGGVAHDLARIGAGVAGALIPGAFGKYETAATIGNMFNMGDDTEKELKDSDRQKRR